ncbi:Serine protease HtrA-like [Dissostichus eleginoides]|uniref:Serine protease HtrA-like n=1 Tax=Dissostichus eleginoides TaxID=100907 RepID=A0AAD9CP74_DISEL|nr:Serine protease HtrA-like [Dissostichus eleginoides]
MHRTEEEERRSGGQDTWTDLLCVCSPVQEETLRPLTSEESLDPAGSLSVEWQVGGASSMISGTPPPTRPRSLRPVSSMFDSGEDFSLDL